jgi:hypothetical protein
MTNSKEGKARFMDVRLFQRSIMDVGEWELYDSGMARMDHIFKSDFNSIDHWYAELWPGRSSAQSGPCV